MRKKVILWGIGVYLVFAVIAVILGDPPESKEVLKEDEPVQQEIIAPIEVEKEPTEVPLVEVTKDEIIANSVKETLGEEYYRGHYVLDDTLYVESYMTDSGSNQRDIEDHYSYSLKVIEYLYDNIPIDNYISIFVSYYANVIESNGNETELSLISIEYIPERIKKINFRQESYKTVPNIAHYIFIHPILR